MVLDQDTAPVSFFCSVHPALVTELIRVNEVSPEETQALLQSVYETLRRPQQAESQGPVAPAAAASAASSQTSTWRQSIKKHTIACLECGSTFRQLSARHLRLHDLTPQAYRQKHGIPRTQPLSSREATARRRELAQEIRPWEAAADKRAAAKAPARRKRAKRGARA